MSSIRISTVVRAIVYPNSEEKLIKAIDVLRDMQIPFCVLGGMSNVLFRSALFEGVVIKTTKIRQKSLAERELTISCGTHLSLEINEISKQDLGGMEGLCGIPGTVGGMVKNNAGAYGYEISDTFKMASCYIPDDNRIIRLSRQEMMFSYRSSILHHIRAILINATFSLVPTSYAEVREKIDAYRHHRLESQPINHPSLGSVFKRCNGVGAGYYVDKAGLKGYRIGGAQISDKHAGFIINAGNATAQDYIKLVDFIKNKVYLDFSVELEEEIEIIE